ncbi:MAG: acyl-CoA dehydrogenase [Acidimicrobiales bacterium]|nr:acyl-CoA dehydrogenase [Acidimicrobiales bacterium]
MPLGVSDEHLELHAAAARWTAAQCPPSVPRALLDAEDEPLPDFWAELADLGWLGLHLGEEHGGEGYGLAELAVVLEELGRAGAPGPFLPTVLTSALIERHGTAAQRDRWLPGLADGSLRGAVAFGSGALTGGSGGAASASGELRPVLGAGLAEVIVVPVRLDGVEAWYVLDRSEVDVTPLPSLDATRRLAAARVDDLPLSLDAALPGLTRGHVDDLAATLLAAEAVGGAAWCLDTAAAYAKVREQFGRPIGQFQAVKHRCADALCRLEEARAATWDAAALAPEHEHFALAAAAAAALAPAAAFACAKDAIQVLGGIGYTWEHDAHLYLRRATAIHHLNGGSSRWREQVVRRAVAGERRTLTLDLPPEAETHRGEVRAAVAQIAAQDKAGWNTLLADGGWLCPHWPRPWGRDATPLEQLVIDEELRAAGIRRRHLQVAGWVLPTLIAHGDASQQERFIGPSLRNELSWCQLFSEPGAGSDLASLTTRAERVDGGWALTGQKVWTTMADSADWGICLARTDPDAPKHDGITCFLLDMSTPGIDVRPLRELTGFALFNEVFLDDVVVPDDCVVGVVDDGWRCARTTLENERVSMSSGSSFGPGVEAVLDLASSTGAIDDPLVRDQLGGLIVTSGALAVMGLRTTLRALGGSSAAVPGPEASVRKLLAVEHEQDVQEAGMSLLGSAAAVDEGDGARWFGGFLGNRALSIAGGTSEIQRNVIAERLLGLPRD